MCSGICRESWGDGVETTENRRSKKGRQGQGWYCAFHDVPGGNREQDWRKGGGEWGNGGITDTSQCPLSQFIGENRVACPVQRLLSGSLYGHASLWHKKGESCSGWADGGSSGSAFFQPLLLYACQWDCACSERSILLKLQWGESPGGNHLLEMQILIQ